MPTVQDLHNFYDRDIPPDPLAVACGRSPAYDRARGAVHEFTNFARGMARACLAERAAGRPVARLLGNLMFYNAERRRWRKRAEEVRPVGPTEMLADALLAIYRRRA